MQIKPRLKRQRALTVQRLEIIRQNLDKTDADVAGMLGVHRTAVHDLRRRYKITKVHGTVRRVQHITEQMEGLKPGLTVQAVAAHLGFTMVTVYKYAKLTGYKFPPLSAAAARHFYWRQRLKSLPPLLTISAVARELGVSWGYAALLCYRHKYKVTTRNGVIRERVPIRRWLARPHHERRLAALKPVLMNLHHK